MTVLFIILIILASFLLGFVVLVQNPKGGGLSGTIGGFNTQFMGVKQTTDVLEKGTWIFAAAIGILCLISTLFISDNTGKNFNVPDKPKNPPIKTTTPAPNTTTPSTSQPTTTP
jgi:preprotein translocase subunit SecG